MWEAEQICPVCQAPARYGLTHKHCLRPDAMDGLVCLWAYQGVAKKIIAKVRRNFLYDILKQLISDELLINLQPELVELGKFIGLKPQVVTASLKPLSEVALSTITTKILARKYNLKANLKGVSHKSWRHNPPQYVLLVDDVWTTGATMNECCLDLKKSGVKQVWGLVLAR